MEVAEFVKWIGCAGFSVYFAIVISKLFVAPLIKSKENDKE